ncbi:hypothetical protein HAX54_041503, partial [Datura stramonium]|nr:hypothetical protein [Datura stramonium]
MPNNIEEEGGISDNKEDQYSSIITRNKKHSSIKKLYDIVTHNSMLKGESEKYKEEEEMNIAE